MERILLPLLALSLLAGAAHAQSVLYRYEMHDATFHSGMNPPGGAAAGFKVHRVGIYDESGIVAAGLASALGARRVGSRTEADGKTYSTWLYQAHPVVPGIRAGLEVAFEGPTTIDVDGDGLGVEEVDDFSYFELRLAVGGTSLLSDWLYMTLEPIDFLMRSVEGVAGNGRLLNDQYAWYVGGELGVLLPLGRVGAYARYDLIRGLFKLIDMGAGDAPDHTWDVGLAAAVGKERLRLEARWGLYQWSHDDFVRGGLNRVEGSLLTLGLNAGF